VTVTPTTGAADLKFTKYVIKAVSATTVDIFAGSDADFGRGTAEAYLTDSLKDRSRCYDCRYRRDDCDCGIWPHTDIRLGTIAMTIGDYCNLEVKSPSTKSMTVKIGGTASTFPEFGCLAMAQKRGNGELVELDIFRCKGIGLPLSFKRKRWSDAGGDAKALYDSTQDGVYSLRVNYASLVRISHLM